MPPKCPECGGKMVSRMKRKVCESCGLSLNASDYDKEWEKIHDSAREKDYKRNRHSEYLEWYQSKKE